MRVTTKSNNWIFTGVRNNIIRNDQRINIHNYGVGNIFKKSSLTALKTGAYRLSGKGEIMTANQEARFLFSAVSRGEISQQGESSSFESSLRQLHKDSRWKIHLKETKEIDLDEDVDPKQVADELEQLTLFLADGDEEKLKELEEAFKKASEKIASGISFDMKSIHEKIAEEMDGKFKGLKEGGPLDKIQVKGAISRNLGKEGYEKLYANVLSKPFEQMKPEITITLESTSTISPQKPMRFCSESVCGRLTEIARNILDQDIATVEELRSAFINGYKEGTNPGLQDRLQEATFYDMMDVFDELKKEYS
jgi:hypothetical protein